MELIKVGEKTYYIKNATNIGVYQLNETDVYIIDTGGDSDAGKKILKIIASQGWTIKGIINTHSHADHIGGNQIIQLRTNCPILAKGIEKCFIEYPILEPSGLYGGNPFSELKNKFLCAKPSTAIEIEDNLPEGLEFISLPGHSPDMIGIKTSDNVYFLGDALLSMETITKYHLFYLYDIKLFRSTLNFLKTLKGTLYIPSHVSPLTDITSLIKKNEQKLDEIIHYILEICQKESTFEEILQQIFNHYQLQMNVNQYVLIGSVLRSYLSNLYEEGKLTYRFVDNQMKWEKILSIEEYF